MTKRISIIGHFGADKDILDGQTVKTRILYGQLKSSTDWKIKKADTYYKSKNPVKLMLQTLGALLTTKDVIVLLSGNGMKFYFPLLCFASRVFGTRVYHDVIGGNLADYVDRYPKFKKYLNSFKVNLVETQKMKAQLEAQGIGVIHATDIHDYPSYNGSYGRSRETIQAILNENPTIKVVLDIHRDAIANETGGYQPYVEIDGKEASQVMIISGCDDGTMGMPNYLHNFRFASYLQQQLESDYPGLTRPILFDYRKYNQDLTTGSLLIEVGSHCNTLEQAQYSGSLIGASLARALNSLK